MTDDEPLITSKAVERLSRVVRAAYERHYLEPAIFEVYKTAGAYPERCFEQFGVDLETALRAAQMGNGLMKNALAANMVSPLPPIYTKDPST